MSQADPFVQLPSLAPAPPSGTSTTVLRHTVSADAGLSAEEVIAILGGRQAVVRAWLRRVPAMWHPSGRRIYRWGDVLDHLADSQQKEVA